MKMIFNGKKNQVNDELYRFIVEKRKENILIIERNKKK